MPVAVGGGVEPELVRARLPRAAGCALLVWRFPEPRLAVSSAPLGGGIGRRHWVINAQVPHSYARLDPEAHLVELAAGLGLEGPGVGMLTAVDVRKPCDGPRTAGRVVDVSVGCHRSHVGGAPDEPVDGGRPAAAPGTINVVGFVPERLSDAGPRQCGDDGDRGQGPGPVGCRDRGHGHGVGRRVSGVSR